MFGSNTPSVLGLVSIRHATSSSALARRSSRSTPPSALVPDLHDRVAGHRHGRRVRAVCRVRGQHLRARVTAVGVEGLGQQHAGQLAVRPGAGLQRDVRQPGDLAQRPLEVPHQLQRALRVRRALQRMQPRVPGQRRDALVQARVVLHRARPQRIEARIEVEVPLRQVHVVAHDLRLAHLRQPRRLGAAEAVGQQSVGLRTSISGQTNARRPGAPSRRSSSRLALHRRLALSSLMAMSVTCDAPLAWRSAAAARAEHLGQAVDVRARALLGDRHQQHVVVSARRAPGFTPCSWQRATTFFAGALSFTANSRTTGWVCSASTPRAPSAPRARSACAGAAARPARPARGAPASVR